MSSNYIFDNASAQFERGFLIWNNYLMLNCEIKRDLSHFIQKKKKTHVKTVEKLQ